MEDEDSGATKTSSWLRLHMKVDHRVNSSRQRQKKKKKREKVERRVFLMLNRMLLPRSRASAGSHHESDWSSPEAERTWHFICLPSSDRTSQSDSPALDDDRGETQPADWPMEAPLHSTEQGRGRGEGGEEEEGEGGGFLQHRSSGSPQTVRVYNQISILCSSINDASVLIF